MKTIVTWSAIVLFLVIAGTKGTQAQVGTPAQEMLDAIGPICIDLSNAGPLNPAESDLFGRCSDVLLGGGDANSQLNAAGQLTSADTSVMKTMTVDITGAQVSSVLRRTAVLRGQAGGGALAANFFSPDGSFNLISTASSFYDGTIGPGATLEPAVDMGTFAMDPEKARPFGGRLGVFINGDYTTGDVDATVNEPGFDHDGGGITIGADYRLSDSFFIGLATSYASTSAELYNSRGDIDVDGYGFSVYSTYNYGDLYFDIVGSYAARDYETVRRVNYTIAAVNGGTSTVQQSFKGDTDAEEWAFSIGTGYNFFVGGFNIGPYGRFNHLTTDIDGYTEQLTTANANTGNGVGLRLNDQDFDSTTTVLGALASYPISTGAGVFTPHVRFGWVHEFDNDARIIGASYVNGTKSNNNNILIPTDEPDRDYYNLAVGVSGVFPYGISAFAEYATVLDLNRVTSNTVAGGVRFEF